MPLFAADEGTRAMTPPGFELVVAGAGTPEYKAAIAEAEYLVGFVDALVKEDLYKAAPKLKLIQLLSAGYDRADLGAARKAKVPISNNGGANSVAVSEHALMLMLAVSRHLIPHPPNVARAPRPRTHPPPAPPFLPHP